MTLSSADIKRQIIMSSGQSDIRKKIEERVPGVSDGEIIEMGNQLEKLTLMPGWTLTESYMVRRMNLVGIVMNDKQDPDQKGIAKGYIELMQWMQLMIQKKNDIMEKERLSHETKNVPQD